VDYRLFKPEDFAVLYAIEEACFQPPHRFSRTYMRQLIQQPDAATWIAEQDGRACGFGIVEWTHEASNTVAYIQTLEVLPEFRGQGIGGELLQRMESSAREAGASEIWLHVDAENAGAIRIYEKHGFMPTGREEDYYGRGRPGLVLSRALNLRQGSTSDQAARESSLHGTKSELPAPEVPRLKA
jgi:ribosomal protein S18 acetylase RimI-like enzyme